MTVREAEKVTLADLEVMIEAEKLRQLKTQELLSYGAFQVGRVFSSSKSGKPIIKKFKDLFDYEKEYRRAFQEPKKKVTKRDLEALQMVAEINRKNYDRKEV